MHTLRTIDKFGGAVNDVISAAAAVLYRFAHAVVAAVHSGAQHQRALDGPMVGGIPGPGNVIFIPLVNGLCIGVDKDASLRLFKLHAGTCRGFDIRIREVVKIDAVGRLRIALNVALVFDVQVAGGVHRQHLAVAHQANVADDILVGDDIHRSTVQQLHPVGSDGHVDPATGVAVVVLGSGVQGSPGHLDVQPGFVLHGQDVGVDAHDGVAIEVAPAVIHVDVHGGAAGEPGLRAVFQGHISGVDAVYKLAVGNGSIAAAVKVDVQRTAAVNFHTAAALGADGACILMGAGALQVQGQRLAGADVQKDAFFVVKQQAVVAADGRVILHIDSGVE